MTRLITDWIGKPEDDFKKYDAKLERLTGMGIPEMAFHAAGFQFRAFGRQFASSVGIVGCRVAAVRMTAGEGVIGSFAETVAIVASHMGAETFIPECSDVAGIHEAVSKGAEILFMADDDRFIALNIKTGAVAENDSATALGYVSALSAMAGGLSGKEALLLGFGRVGREALKCLLASGASVKIYDRDGAKTQMMHGKESVEVISELPLPLSGLVFDATNEGGYLGANDISNDIAIAAPGIPLSFDEEAYRVHHDRIIHDPLHLGVAIMLALAVKI